MKRIVTEIENVIDEITGSNLLIHMLMIVAAIASYGNVEAFFASAHTNGTTSKSLAIVLGVALVVASSRLSAMDFARLKHDRNMQFVVAIAVALAVVSGLIQTYVYMLHYNMAISISLGFGIPVLLEVAPAATVALLKAIESTQRTENLRRTVEERMSVALETAVQQIDTELVHKEIAVAARLFTQESVNNIFGELFHRLQESSQHKLTDYTTSAMPVSSVETDVSIEVTDCYAIAKQLHSEELDCNTALQQLQVYQCDKRVVARALYLAGYSMGEIATVYNVSKATISRHVASVAGV